MNLKSETLARLSRYNKSIEDIDYCHIQFGSDWSGKDDILRDDFDIDKLDFEYDNGYGSQEVFGFIVFKDGTWFNRAEYDGSEWYDYIEKPSKPEPLQ